MQNRFVSFWAVVTLVISSAALEVRVSGADIPYSGEVVKVDSADHQMVVKNPQSGGRIRFTVTESTAITSGNEKKGLGDIKSGEAVEIEYVLEGGKYIAHKIILKSSGGK